MAADPTDTAPPADPTDPPVTAARWPIKRCAFLGWALGLLAITVLAVVTKDAVSAALGGAFTVVLAVVVALPVWGDIGDD